MGAASFVNPSWIAVEIRKDFDVVTGFAFKIKGKEYARTFFLQQAVVKLS
jgi:hypothetical protein